MHLISAILINVYFINRKIISRLFQRIWRSRSFKRNEVISCRVIIFIPFIQPLYISKLNLMANRVVARKWFWVYFCNKLNTFALHVRNYFKKSKVSHYLLTSHIEAGKNFKDNDDVVVYKWERNVVLCKWNNKGALSHDRGDLSWNSWLIHAVLILDDCNVIGHIISVK